MSLRLIEPIVLDNKSALDKRIRCINDMFSSRMFWMFTDDQGHVENYDGDAWPLPKEAFSHPRSNGAFATVLRSSVRERGLMSLQEPLRKMTLRPAQTL